MKSINKYITEAWSGVKKQSHDQEIKSWCEDMGIKDYTINSQGEIDVKGHVHLQEKDFKELPYKFGKVNRYFLLEGCENLISLKNCPDEVGEYFACNYCKSLKSLEGCPKEVNESFWCKGCGKFFNEKYIRSMCPNLGGLIFNK